MHESTRLLRDLVAIPSVNPMGRPLQGPEFFEYRVTEYLDKYFRDLGASYERQAVATKRENVVARFDPPGPVGRTLILEAHQDTVPTDGMTIDPFGARIEGGRLFGRGACDVKGGMASMITAFSRLVRERPRIGTRVFMCCSADEEHGFTGITRLSQSPFIASSDVPVLAVCAEPTLLNIVTTHKGAVRWTLETKGRSCHSSRPSDGINAVYRMAELLPLVERYAAELQKQRTHPALGPATLSVGIIEGGVSVNTVPDRCAIAIDRRLLPGETAEEAHGHFREFLRENAPSSVAWECLPPWLSAPALDVSEASKQLANRLGAAIDEVVGSHQCLAAPYGTDAAPLAQAGVAPVVFGPGDIAKAHTTDESIPLDQVEQASEILFRLACQD